MLYTVPTVDFGYRTAGKKVQPNKPYILSYNIDGSSTRTGHRWSGGGGSLTSPGPIRLHLFVFVAAAITTIDVTLY
jgi:hypothetical protein